MNRTRREMNSSSRPICKERRTNHTSKAKQKGPKSKSHLKSETIGFSLSTISPNPLPKKKAVYFVAFLFFFVFVFRLALTALPQLLKQTAAATPIYPKLEAHDGH